MPKSMISMLMLCLVYVVISGCGTKGPLYIPEQRYPQEEVLQKDSSQETPETAPQANPEATMPSKEY